MKDKNSIHSNKFVCLPEYIRNRRNKAANNSLVMKDLWKNTLIVDGLLGFIDASNSIIENLIMFISSN